MARPAHQDGVALVSGVLRVLFLAVPLSIVSGCAPGVMQLAHSPVDAGDVHARQGSIVVDPFTDTRSSWATQELGKDFNILSTRTEPTAAEFLADVFRKEAARSAIFTAVEGDTAECRLTGRLGYFHVQRIPGQSAPYLGVPFAAIGGIGAAAGNLTLGVAGVGAALLVGTFSRDSLVATVSYEAVLQRGGRVVWEGAEATEESCKVLKWTGAGHWSRVGAELLDEAATTAVRNTLRRVSVQLSPSGSN